MNRGYQAQSMVARPEEYRIAQDHPHLNRAQKDLIEEVLSSTDRVQGIQGFASAGKTTTLAVLRTAAETQGYEVQGLRRHRVPRGNFGKLALKRELCRASLRVPAHLEAAREPRRIYFIDKSSLASTRHVREFLIRLGHVDRVLLIGEIRQHQGVKAGRAFKQLQQAGMRTAKFGEIVGQRNPALEVRSRINCPRTTPQQPWGLKCNERLAEFCLC
jgi:AAA domain